MFTSPVYTDPIIPYWNALVMFGIFAAGSLAISALRASLQREKAIAREIQATLRLLSAMYASPRDLCTQINEFMFRNLGPANLITFFFGIVDTSTNTLVFTNAGQTRPLLVCADGTSCELCDGGIPLGVQARFPYEEGTVMLVPGDFLVLYTDGLVELTNMKNEMFGVQKLTDLLTAQRDHHAAAVRDSILNAVKEFGRTQLEDDLTLLVLSVGTQS